MFKFQKYGYWYLLGALALACFTVWSAAFYVEARRGHISLHILDVGQGDAVFIEAPNGNQVLIDGGPDASVIARLGEVMPFWDRSIDLVVLTHPHADHLDGLVEVLKRYRVGAVLESGVNHSIAEYAEWGNILREKKIPRIVAKRGATAHLGAGARFLVLYPFGSFDRETVKNIHDAAVVIRMEYASTSAMLMADAEAAAERRLIAAGDNLRADVLKAGHHGSRTSTSEELLRAVGPEFAVISAGRRNRYGHPTQEVVDRLASNRIKVYRTDKDGSIGFVSDGKNFTPLGNKAKKFY